MFLPSFVTPTPGGLTSPRTEIMHFTVVADLGEMSGWAAVESMVEWPSVGSSDFVADFLWFLWGWRSFNNLKGIMKQLGRHSDTAFFVIFVTCGILWPYLWQLKVPRHPRYKVCVRTLEDNFPELVKRIVLTSAPHAWVSRGLDLEHGWWQIPFKSTISEYIRCNNLLAGRLSPILRSVRGLMQWCCLICRTWSIQLWPPLQVLNGRYGMEYGAIFNTIKKWVDWN
jgi:hypothetical protein